MPDRTEVTYALNVQPTPAAGRTLEDLIGKSKTLKHEADEAAKSISRVGAAGGGMRGGGGGISGGGIGGGGYVPPILSGGNNNLSGSNLEQALGGRGTSQAQLGQMLLGRRILPGLTAALAIHTARSTVEFGTQGMRAESNPDYSEFQKDRVLKETFPVLGGFFKDWLAFVDELGKWGPRFRELQRKAEQYRRETEIGDRYQQTTLGLRAQQAGAEAHGRATIRALQRTGQDALLDNPDPRFAGVRASRIGQYVSQGHLEESQERMNFAGAELATANTDAERYAKMVAIQRRKVESIHPGPNENEKQLALDKERVLYGDLLNKSQVAIERSLRAQKEYASAAKDVEAARNQLSEANLANARERMQLLQHEKQELKSGVMQFGMMRPEEQGAAVRAAERLKEYGPQVLSDRERALVGRAGLFDKLTEMKSLQAGMASPFLNDALRVGGLRGFGELDKQIQNVKLDLDIRFVNEAEAADKFRTAVVGAVKEAFSLETLKKLFAEQQAQNEQAQRKALSPTGGK